MFHILQHECVWFALFILFNTTFNLDTMSYIASCKNNTARTERLEFIKAKNLITRLIFHMFRLVDYFITTFGKINANKDKDREDYS